MTGAPNIAPKAVAMADAETCPEAAGLPPLSSSYGLTPEQIAGAAQDGHVKLAQVFSGSEIAAYRPHLKRVVAEHQAQSHAMEQKVAGTGKNWMFVDNLWRLAPAARAFVLSPRLGRIAAQILGVDAVRLFRDQSYFKGPGGANTPWHQDAYFMPLDTEKILTMWIPLTDITPDLAPMDYVTGSHRTGYLGTSNGDDANMDRFASDLAAKGLQTFNYGTLQAGDVAVHSAWTLHSSRRNTSPLMREAVVIVYFADGARMTQDPALSRGAPGQEYYAKIIRRQNRETSLPGVRPGELAQGPMVPVVYDRAWDARP
jgi:ectoine hydroxylase-related dioxygenase (phytanoyl-CoA dioxygenase family)